MFGRIASGASRRSLQREEPKPGEAEARIAESSSQAQERARREEEERRTQQQEQQDAVKAAEAVSAVEAFQRARPTTPRSKGKAPEGRRRGGEVEDADDEDDPPSRSELPSDSPFLDQDVMGTFGRSSASAAANGSSRNYSPAIGSSRFFTDASPSPNPPSLLFLATDPHKSRARIPSNATDRTQDSLGEVSQLFPSTPSRPDIGGRGSSGSGTADESRRGSGLHSLDPSTASSDPTVMEFVEQDGMGERGGVGEKPHTPVRTLTQAQVQNIEERNRILLKALPDTGSMVASAGRERERKRGLDGRSMSVPDAPTPSVLLADGSASSGSLDTVGALTPTMRAMRETTSTARDPARGISGLGGSGGRDRRGSSPTTPVAAAAFGSGPVAVALSRRSEDGMMRSSKSTQRTGPAGTSRDIPRAGLSSSFSALESVPSHPLQDTTNPRDRKRSERSVTASPDVPLITTPATRTRSFEIPPRRGSLSRTHSPGLLTFLEAEQRARKSLTFPRTSLQEPRRSLQLPESPALASSRQRYNNLARRSTPDMNLFEERNSFADPYAEPISGFHRLSMQSRAASMSTLFASQQRARAHQLLHELAALQPRFPSKREFRASDLPLKSNLWARVHHFLLPLSVALPIFASIYFDFNCLFILTELATLPDDPASGSSTAWYVATGVYAFCVLAWLGFVVLVHDFLVPYRKFGREGKSHGHLATSGRKLIFWHFTDKPLALPIYLSSPAHTLVSMKSFAHYSFLQRARWRAARKDFLAETCLFYSQSESLAKALTSNSC
jgi:hypothetical protein